MGGKSSAPQYGYNGLQAQSAPTSSFANPAPPMGTPAINSYAQQFNGPAQQYGGGKFPNGAQAQAPSKWGQQAPPGPNTGWGTTSSGQNQDAPGFTNPYDTAPTSTTPTPTSSTPSTPLPNPQGGAQTWAGKQEEKAGMSGNQAIQTGAPGQFMNSIGLDAGMLAGANGGGGATTAQAQQVTAAFNKLPANEQLSLLNSGAGGSSLYNMLIQGGNSQAAQGSWYAQANDNSGFGAGNNSLAYGGQQGGATTAPTFASPNTTPAQQTQQVIGADGFVHTVPVNNQPPQAPTVPGNPFGPGTPEAQMWNQQHATTTTPTPNPNLNRSTNPAPTPRTGPVQPVRNPRNPGGGS